jgi:hypothetical protein
MVFDFCAIQFIKDFVTFNDRSPEFAACCTVSALQTANISCVVIAFGIMTHKLYFTTPFALITLGIFIVMNYIRYIWNDKSNIDSIKKRWEMKSINYQRNSKFFQGIYIIISLLVFVSLVIYLVRNR